ncbi:hypothetical protein Selli1_10080 [Sellimonas catena]|uniref:Uncharacterized protein n=1 Tax=Sellimonas catena TaxID=2994035 RepID=A0A9W6FC07_9FIRM|nr:hypothetical protein Selli1_10080 [Sellimonas catena]
MTNKIGMIIITLYLRNENVVTRRVGCETGSRERGHWLEAFYHGPSEDYL